MQGECQKAPRCEVRDRVASILSEIADIPLASITDSATVDGELAIGSITFVQLCVAFEQEYDIEIDPIRVITLNRFSAIVDYIHDLAVGAGRWAQSVGPGTAS